MSRYSERRPVTRAAKNAIARRPGRTIMIRNVIMSFGLRRIAQSRSPVSRSVFVVAGSVLLAAAILKGTQMAGDPFGRHALFANRTLAILMVMFEGTLGLWLLTGAYPRTARAVGAVCFLTFFVVSARQVALGRSSCGCFGNVELTPWVTAAVDLVAAVLLLLTSPPSPAKWSYRLAVGAGVASALAMAPAWWLTSPTSKASQLSATPSVVSLGTVGRGQKAEVEIFLSNNSPGVIRLGSVETSCPCLSVQIPEAAVEPGGATRAEVVLDLATEPYFIGKLGMTARGYSTAGEQVFQVVVTADVRNR